MSSKSLGELKLGLFEILGGRGEKWEKGWRKGSGLEGELGLGGEDVRRKGEILGCSEDV